MLELRRFNHYLRDGTPMQQEMDPTDEALKGYYIPPKPEILTELQQLANRPQPDPVEIAEVVARDVGLSAAVLKTINSPFFGMRRTISDIKQAALLLGVSNLTGLATAYEMRRAIAGDSCISLERFWDSAADVAEALVAVGRLLKLSIPPEDLYTVGLFHDCGIPILAVKHADYVDVLGEANLDFSKSIIELEEARYTTNHAVVGYFVSSSWGIPRYICKAILQHHEQEVIDGALDEKVNLIIAALKVAENIVSRARRMSDDPDWQLFEEFALTQLGMSEPDYEDLEADVTELLS